MQRAYPFKLIEFICHPGRGMGYTCAPDYYSISFLSGCISVTNSVLGPNPDKEMHTHTPSHQAKEMKRETENQ